MNPLALLYLGRTNAIQAVLSPSETSERISVCKINDAVDFFRPEVIAHIRRVGEEPRLHGKQWEYAQVLEARERYAPNARRILGLGCGREATIPVLCEGAEEFVASDLYG